MTEDRNEHNYQDFDVTELDEQWVSDDVRKNVDAIWSLVSKAATSQADKTTNSNAGSNKGYA